jgi:hypothetical protein
MCLLYLFGEYTRCLKKHDFQKFNFKITARALPVINIHIYRCTCHSVRENNFNVKYFFLNINFFFVIYKTFLPARACSSRV